MIAFAMLYGPMGAFLPELYGTRLRYSGASVSYNRGGVLGGALAPIIATQLLASTGESWSISLYMAAMAAVSFVCVFLLSETSPRSARRSAGSSPSNRRLVRRHVWFLTDPTLDRFKHPRRLPPAA
jgi:MFS family permease